MNLLDRRRVTQLNILGQKCGKSPAVVAAVAWLRDVPANMLAGVKLFRPMADSDVENRQMQTSLYFEIPPPHLPPKKERGRSFSDTTFAERVPVLLFVKSEDAATLDPSGELHVTRELHFFVYSVTIRAVRLDPCTSPGPRRPLDPGLAFLVWSCHKFDPCAGVSQGGICSNNGICCHTAIEVADQTFYLTQSQYTDTGLSSLSADSITPGFCQGSHRSTNYCHWCHPT